MAHRTAQQNGPAAIGDDFLISGHKLVDHHSVDQIVRWLSQGHDPHAAVNFMRDCCHRLSLIVLSPNSWWRIDATDVYAAAIGFRVRASRPRSRLFAAAAASVNRERFARAPAHLESSSRGRLKTRFSAVIFLAKVKPAPRSMSPRGSPSANPALGEPANEVEQGGRTLPGAVHTSTRITSSAIAC